MKHRVAVYVDDYMILLELASKIDAEYPLVELLVFGSDRLTKEFKDKSLDYDLQDISKLNEADILIVLARPSEHSSEIANFDGTILDAINYSYADDAEVIAVTNPIQTIFDSVDRDISALSATVWLPVCVFGQAGVEDLMAQTKDIFTFHSSDYNVIEDRLAFNIHFEPEYIGLSPIYATFNALRKEGLDLSVRMMPLSTVFIIDVSSDDDFELFDNDRYLSPSGYHTAENLPEDKILATKRRNGYTFTGDYLRIYIENVLQKLKEVV